MPAGGLLLAIALAAGAGPLVETREVIVVHAVHAGAHDAELLRALRESFEPYVAARLVGAAELPGMSPERLQACAQTTSLWCWVEVVRDDRAATIERRTLLLISAHAPDGAVAQLTTVSLDTERALELHRRAERGDPAWLERVEDAIFGIAGRESGAVTLGEASSAAAWAANLRERLRPMFERRGLWQPHGVLVVRANAPALAIELDGRTVATTADGAVRVAGVPAGKRLVGVRDPSGARAPFSRPIEVAAGATVELTAEVTAARSELRDAVRWAGIGAGVAGAAVLTYAIVAPRPGFRPRLCPGGMCGEAESGFATASDYASGSEPYGDGGVLLAPLGYSVLLAGATWWAGTALFGEEWDDPWIQLAAGLALGGLTYGVSAAVSE